MRLAACLVLTATLITGCGGGSATSVEGTWQASGLATGSSLVLDLNEERGGVAGSGTFTDAGGRSGRLVVTGMQGGKQVELAWTYDSGERFQYSATMPDGDHLSGNVTMVAPSTSAAQPLQFVRQ